MDQSNRLSIHTKDYSWSEIWEKEPTSEFILLDIDNTSVYWDSVDKVERLSPLISSLISYAVTNQKYFAFVTVRETNTDLLPAILFTQAPIFFYKDLLIYSGPITTEVFISLFPKADLSLLPEINTMPDPKIRFAINYFGTEVMKVFLIDDGKAGEIAQLLGIGRHVIPVNTPEN